MVLKRFHSPLVRYNFSACRSFEYFCHVFANKFLWISTLWAFRGSLVEIRSAGCMNESERKTHGKNIKMFSAKLKSGVSTIVGASFCFCRILKFVFSAAHAKGSWNEKPVHILYGAFCQPQTEIWKKPLWFWKKSRSAINFNLLAVIFAC